jgi:Zn-dependent metalloprotease
VNAEKYKWEDPNEEDFIKQLQNNPLATYYPQGELVIAKNYQQEGNLFKLSWKFYISSLQPHNEQMIFVDAITGEIIQVSSLINNANTPGYAQTMYSDFQNITCDSYQGNYRLYEERSTTPGNSAIINTEHRTNVGNIEPYINTSTNWTEGNWVSFTQDQKALDVHWGMEKTLDYWSSVHNRNSFDDLGMTCL